MTKLDEVVMYGIDADTWELLRYTFDTDTYTRIGVVTDQWNNVVDDIECLTLFPYGVHQGTYGVANSRAASSRSTGSTRRPWPFRTPSGSRRWRGWIDVAVRPLERLPSGAWTLIGACYHDPVDDDPALLTMVFTTKARDPYGHVTAGFD